MNNPILVELQKLNPNIETPFYNITEVNGKKILAAGLDIFARGDYKIPSAFATMYNFAMGLSKEEPKIEHIIPLNIKINYPEGTMALLFPRSSLCLKKHLRVCNSIGLIDESFKSEHGLIVENAGWKEEEIKDGEKIAQLVFFYTLPVDIKVVKNIEETEHKGFGSTGGYIK